MYDIERIDESAFKVFVNGRFIGKFVGGVLWAVDKEPITVKLMEFLTRFYRENLSD